MMEFVELKKSLTAKIEPAYVLFGKDSFLLNKSAELIVKACDIQNTELDIEKINDPNLISGAISSARTPSFFGGRRVIIVRAYLSEDKKPEILKEFAEYFKNPDNQNVLIIIIDSEKEPSALKGAMFVDCNPMSLSVVQTLILRQFKEAGKSVSPSSASYIAEACECDYNKINNEIMKLIAYSGDASEIPQAVIAEFVQKTKDMQIFELANSIISGNAKKSSEILENLLAQNIDEYMIFGGLVSMLRRAFYASATTAGVDLVASVIGGNPFAITYARRDYAKSAARVRALYEKALGLEFAIKNGKIGVLSAIASLCL
ncbi:MAG: DNA polymerase III subunit delta [Christensenellaceae bacterium]|jgi:DNA polymerase-3 subunit delta|nr:DNA polymerase III subunit delta [Christensenellaceae bacterium]